MKLCPHCKKPLDVIPKRPRTCTVCLHPITRYHKWYINGEGKIQHRHCDNPESYLPKDMELYKAPSIFDEVA